MAGSPVHENLTRQKHRRCINVTKEYSFSRVQGSLPKILVDKGISIFVLECQHATSRMLDQNDLLRAQKLLGNHNAS